MTMIIGSAGQDRASATTSPLLNLVLDAARGVVRQMRIRQAERHLLELSDAQLSDIGISRCEIESATRTGRSLFL